MVSQVLGDGQGTPLDQSRWIYALLGLRIYRHHYIHLAFQGRRTRPQSLLLLG